MAQKKLSAVIQIGGAVAGSLRSAFGTVTKETEKVGAAIQRLTDRQRQLNAEVARVGRDGSNAASLRVQYANQELQTIGRQIALLRQRQAIEQAQQVQRDRRGELRGKIGSTMATGAVLAAPIGLAIKEAAEFDYELQLIGNTAEMTKTQVRELGRAVIDTSKATGQSATNIRKGMGFLVAAGMRPEQATEFLGAIGKTATAANADVEDLSKMVFTLADSMKIKPAGMMGAIDSLTQAGKEGNVELRDMAKQLPVLGAGMVSLKMEGREAAATLGAALQIARKGAADADEASNNMKNFIAKIMSPETLKKAKKNFHLDLYKIIQDAQKTGGNPFEASMEAIIKATKGDQKAIGELFQDMQVQNFLRPMIQQWDEYKRIKAKALGADGVVERDFATMMDTTKQKITEVSNAMGRLGIAFGAVFTGGTGERSNALADRIGQLAQFVEAHRDLVRVSVQVVGGLFAMRLATLGAQYAWSAATSVVLGARAVWLAAPGIIGGVGGAVRVLALSFALLQIPLWPVVAGVAAVAAVGALVYKYWEPLKALFSGFFEGMGAALAPIGQAFRDAFAPVWEVISPVVMPALEAVGGWLKSAIGWFGELFTPIDAASRTTLAFGEAGKLCGEVVGTAFRLMLSPIMAVLDAIKWINDNIGGVIAKVQDFTGRVGAAVAGAKNTVSGWFGGSQAPAASGGGSPLPQVPPMASARGASSTVQDNSQNTYHFTLPPNSDPKALADEIERRQRQRAGVRARSSLVDGVGAQ